MIIGGFQKFSLIDYPDKISAIIFTKGCNFRCGYCHNPELFESDNNTIDVDEILKFLSNRQGKLDGVVITGGEPTLQNDLVEFIQKIKDLNFLVKLDTNGTNPEILIELIDKKLLDYIAMDIKAPLEKYTEITNVKIDLEKIEKSIKLIKNSRVKHEFRTTIVKEQLNIEDFKKIGKIINGSDYYLQKFVPSKLLNPDFKEKTSYSDEEFLILKNLLGKYTSRCFLRT